MRPVQLVALATLMTAALPVARADVPPAQAQAQAQAQTAAPAQTPAPKANGSKPEAIAHFERGSRHYQEGRYDEAIAEYEAAYRAQPHPSVLYNIAQAHERLLVYPKAVEYFQRYLAEAGPNARHAVIVQNRLRALTQLPARLTISSEPSGATVLVRGQAIGKTPLVNANVTAGPATIEVKLPGYFASTTERALELGQPYILQYTLRRRTGVLTVRSRPSGARVLVGDRLLGTTPLSEAVGAGQLNLVLEHDGYLKAGQLVSVRPDERTEADIRLPKLPPDRRAGRNELIADATIYGGWVGFAIAEVAGARDSARPLLDPRGNPVLDASGKPVVQGPQYAALILPAVGGAVVAPLLTALATRRGDITQGQTQLISGGTIWGSLQGVYVALAAGGDARALYAGALGGGAVGVGVSLLVGRRLDVNVNPGDVGMFNSAVFWTNGLAALAVGTAAAAANNPNQKPALNQQQAGGIMTGANTAGIVTGILLANFLESTRLRLFLIDVTGAVGGLTGFGAAFGLQKANNERNDLLAAGAAGGIVAGLVAGAIWTHYLLPRDPDAAPPGKAARASSRLARRLGGALVGRDGESGRWRVQVPRPQPLSFAPPGQTGLSLSSSGGLGHALGSTGFGLGINLLEPSAW
jgi:hypothetical protein